MLPATKRVSEQCDETAKRMKEGAVRPPCTRFFKSASPDPKDAAALRASLGASGIKLIDLQQERCFTVELAAGASPLTPEQEGRLRWLVAETFEPGRTGAESSLTPGGGATLLEVGPRLTFCTAWSSNAVSICHACGLTQVTRIECFRRYMLRTSPAIAPSELAIIAESVHDRMTECVYATPLESFDSDAAPAPTRTIPLIKLGRGALEALNDELGLGFDEADLEYYTKLFVNELKRDPTDVECFDMAQSNSEHSRHWFFSGNIVIDGVQKPNSLFSLVKATLIEGNRSNSVIAFHDNSSSIRGADVRPLRPTSATGPSPYAEADDTYHLLLTAETHNFPCGVAPFPGAETGTGGRLRDTHAAGRGSLPVAGISAYCTGNLNIPGYEQPWEDSTYAYPDNMARPLRIMVEASNGASDYGNKFGEPVICGFARSFGMTVPNGERREWIKPIMFSAGLGQIPDTNKAKGAPKEGMHVVKLGGPAYRIGMGGGAASSRMQDKARADLDFNAVQRGDAEMENKMNRVVRACVEMGEKNPIVSIHDQGAGGNGNVLKEICEPHGAHLDIRKIISGDASLSVLELWGAEYQENSALLIRPEHKELFEQICARENSPAAFVGTVTNDGRVRLVDSSDGSVPFDLPLDLVLGEMPRKTFHSETAAPVLKPLALGESATVGAALDRVLRLPSVGSKRFLTNKVDRSVSGLIAQQQCVGPLHIPLADVGVIAQTHGGITGGATAVGEQPIKGMLSPSAMARLTVAEAVTNLVFAAVGPLDEVKCSANWMWAAKLPSEGAAMYDACEAMSTFMKAIGVAVDGGKDSLSMAARVADETVKCPGTLVVTVYSAVPDIRLTLTPDLKVAGSRIVHVDVAAGLRRLGGSALAQCYSQLGDASPDVEKPALLAGAFKTTQSLLRAKALLAGHDISDGGLLISALEMAFTGDVGIALDIPACADPSALGAFGPLFAEEVGLLLEVSPEREGEVLAAFAAAGVPTYRIGTVTAEKSVHVSVGGQKVIDGVPMVDLRDTWEATSFQLERLQADPRCVAEEEAGLRTRHAPAYKLTYAPSPSAPLAESAPRVAVLRQEGSNGDREMAAALFAGGLAPWDVSMSDLAAGRASLDAFRGVVFVGGFSYADVLDSAKGWAGVIRFSAGLRAQFDAFRSRRDTFSLGVCNGCQLMALLGWVGSGEKIAEDADANNNTRFVHNNSGRFESRWSTVTVAPSPAIMLKGMEGSTLGVWVAHGEGRAHFPHAPALEHVLEKNLAPIRYVDDDGAITQAYPHNPNGSVHGIAGLCSDDGRHLAMMPHPERAFATWQNPWMPPAWKDELAAAPWLRLFQNAATWADENKAVK